MPKGFRVDDPIQLPAPGLIVQTGAEYERWVVERAHYFTCVWKKGPGEVAGRENEYLTLKEAIAVRADDPRKMIYAVYELNRAIRNARSVMIGPTQYAEMLLLRKEGLIRRLPKRKQKC